MCIRDRVKNAPSPTSCQVTTYLFFLLGRWVSAEPATDLTALLDFGLRSNLAAFDATGLLVTSLFTLRGIDITSFR
ncbi:MAG: hypothetical protein MPK62_08225, partial [Alphaproteobacteria bacterium]|nr:hypothetical protein [Alphaproteobacteria bacterium]